MLDKLKESLKDIPIVDINGYQYFIHPLSDGVPSIEPELLNEVTERLLEICDFNCDYILTSEAMGIPISTALSLRTSVPMMIIRKRSYGLSDEIEVHQQTGYSKNSLYINGLKKGDRVTIIDDVISTGGTMCAILDTVINKIGCKVVDAAVIFGKSDVSKDIEKRYGICVKSVIKVTIKDGIVTEQN